MFFPSLHKSLAEKSESKMSEYHFHREPSENAYFLMHLKQASMSASEIHPSTADFFTQRPCWETAPRSLNVDQRAKYFADCFYLWR